MTTTERHPSTTAILRHFETGHLPPHLAAVSNRIGNVAREMVAMLPDDPELVTGLRKLLEAKDCLVRVAVIKAKAEPEGRPDEKPEVVAENPDDKSEGPGFHRGGTLASSERAWTPTILQPETLAFGFGRSWR